MFYVERLFLSVCYNADVPGIVTPADVLAFITGCPVIPPMGFPTVLQIKFIADKEKRLPTASTCGLHINLPLALQEYEDFKAQMNFALSNTIGFGQV